MRIVQAIALVPVTVAGLLYCTEIARADAFSFPSAEFMPGDDGVRAAQSFIKDQLPRGCRSIWRSLVSRRPEPHAMYLQVQVWRSRVSISFWPAP